jgi:hypothetical protein
MAYVVCLAIHINCDNSVQGVWKTNDITQSPVQWMPVTDFDAELRPVSQLALALCLPRLYDPIFSGDLLEHRRSAC